MPNNTKRPSVPNYLKNVTKSIIFSTADIGKDIMPDVAEFGKMNTDFVKQTYAKIKMPPMQSRRRMKGFMQSKIFQPLDYGIKNIKEDLRTGDFYAKEREERDLAKLSGFDFDDFENFDDLDNFDVDLDSSEKSSQEVTKGDLKVIQSIEGSNAAAAQATINAIIATSDNATKNSRMNAAMSFEQNERIFGGLHQDLSAIGATLNSIFKLQNAALQNIDSNMSSYQTEHLKLENERNAILKEMLEMQRNTYKIAQEKELEAARYKSSKKSSSPMFAINSFSDMSDYFDKVKKNFNDEFGLILGMLGIGGGGGGNFADTLSSLMVTPTRDMTNAIIKFVMPKMMKDAMANFNETFSGAFSNIIVRLAGMENKAGLPGIIGRILGKVNPNVNRTIDTGNYEKGKVDWDGISRRALTSVIPGYLRRIEAHLSGGNEIDYDFKTGKWINMSSASAEFKNIKQGAYRSATFDLMQAMNKTLERNAPSGAQARADYDAGIEEFRQYLYDVNGVFYPNKSASENGITSVDYPHLYKYYSQIAKSFDEYDIVEQVDRNGNVIVGRRAGRKSSAKSSLARNILDQKNFEDRRYRDIESNVDSSLGKLFEYTDKIKVDSAKGTGGILGLKDKYGQTIHSYLHNINQELLFWRMNYGATGFGGKKKKYNNAPKFSFESLNNKLITSEQMAANAAAEAEAANNQNNYDAGAYRKNALDRVRKGNVNDLRDLDRKEIEYLLDLSMLPPDKLKQAYKQAFGGTGDFDVYSQSYADFFQKQFRGPGFKNMEEINNAIQKATETGKNTYDITKERKGIIGKVLNAFDKTQSTLQGLFTAPGAVFSNVLSVADRSIYEMFFKHDITDGNTYKGFLDLMVGKTKDAFESLKTAIEDKLINPLKEKLGLDNFKNRFVGAIKSTVGGLGNRVVQANRDVWFDPLMNKAMASGNRFFGEYAARGPMQGSLSRQSAEDFANLPENIRKAYRDTAYRASALGGADLARRMKKVGFTGTIEEKKQKLIAYGADPARVEAAISHAKDDAAADEALNKIYSRLDIAKHAKGTIGYTGNTMLSEGELLFNDSGVSMVEETGVYKVNKPTQILNSRDSYDLLSALGIKSSKSRKSVQRDEALENIKERELFKKHAGGTFRLEDFFGPNARNNTGDQNQNNNEQITKKFIEQFKQYVPEVAAGGVLGGLATTILGIAGGPILGAALGAGGMLISKSKTLQKVLFGEVGEDGEEKSRGLISRKIQDTVKKYAPDMTKYGLVGLTASLITPLGPIGGILAGSAIGYLKQNEDVRNTLFGRIGVGEDEKSIIKKLLPGAGKGALAGVAAGAILGGPFGIAGNAILGSALGMMASTDEFKESVLGKSINGMRVGGIVGTIKEAFDPLREAADTFKTQLLDALEKNIIKPISDFVQPAIHAIPQLMAFIPRKIGNLLGDKFKWGANHIVEKLIVNPVSKIAKPVTSAIGKAVNVATSPVRLLGKAGNAIRYRQMKTGNADYMTAEERINWKIANKRGSEEEIKGDKFFAGLSADQASTMLDQLTSIDDNAKDLAARRDKVKKTIINKISKYRTEEGYRISTKCKDAIKKAINKDRLDDIPRILQTYKLEGTDHGMSDAQVRAFLQDTELNKNIADFKSLTSRHRRVSKITANERDDNRAKLQQTLKDAGISEFDLSKVDGRQKLQRYLQTEIDYKKSDEFGATEEATRLKFANETNTNVKTITDILRDINEKGIKLVNLTSKESRQEITRLRTDIDSGIEATEETSDKYADINRSIIGDKANNLNEAAQAAIRQSGDHHKMAKIVGTRKMTVKSKQIKAIANDNVSADTINAIFDSKIKFFGGRNNALKRAVKLSNIRAKGKILKLDPAAAVYAAKLNNAQFNNAYNIIKNKWVSSCIRQAKRPINEQDIKDAIRVYPSANELYSKAKYIAQNGMGSNFATILDIFNADAGELYTEDNKYKRFFGKPDFEETIEDTDTNAPDHHFLGALLGGAGALIGGAARGIKKLFGGKEDDGRAGFLSKLGGTAAALFGANNQRSSTGGGSINGEVDATGDNRSLVQTSEGPAYITRKTDGSVEYDTTDGKTKDIVNKLTLKEKAAEKLQQAQLKASEALHNAFNSDGANVKKKSKGLGWLAALLLGRALLKTGLAQKLWNGIIKPIWSDHLKPFITDKALPFLKEKVLLPAGDWIVNSALPAIGKFTTNKLIPALGKLLGTVAKGILQELPRTIWNGIKGIFKTGGSFLDALVGNPYNAGESTSINPTDKTGESGMVDENGNVLTWEQINSGEFGKIYNTQGTEGTVDEDGNLVFKDKSIKGAGYATTVGNAAARSFANPKIGAVMSKALTKGVNIVTLPGRKLGGKIGKAIAGATRLGAKSITAPITGAAKASTKLGAYTRGLVDLIDYGLSPQSAKVIAENRHATAAAQKAAAKATADKTVIGKIAEKAKVLIADFLEKPRVANMLNRVATFLKLDTKAMANFIPRIKNGIINTFDNFILKAAGRVGADVAKQALRHLGPIVTGAFAVYDFISGCDRAEEFLGVTETSVLDEFVCGIVKALCNLLIIPAIFPGVNTVVQDIYKLFGKDLTERQAAAEEEYKQYVEDTGSTLTKEEYLRQEYSAAGKVKGFFSNIGKKLTTTFSPKNITTKASDGLMKLLESNKGFNKDEIASSFKADQELLGKAKDGSISVFSKDYWSGVLPKDDSLSSIFNSVTSGINRVLMAPIFIVKGAVNSLLNGIRNIGSWIADTFGGLKDFFTNPLDFIYKKITGQKTSDDSTVESKYINQDAITLATGQSASTSISKASTNTAPYDAVNSTKTNTNANNKQGNILTRGVSRIWGGIKKLFGFGAGEGPQYIPAFGTGAQYSKQIDPNIANLRFNSNSDHDYQTIGDSGCGPAAAVNVLESVYGRGSNPVVDAANFALARGYKETDGGTRPEFFTDYFARNGLNSDITYNKSQVEKRINAGYPTVLMGSDNRGTSNSHPFGRNPHYVTVTGVDANGNAIVQDPESKYSDQVYKVSDLVRKTTLGVSAYGKYPRRVVRRAYGRGRYGRGKSKVMFVGDSRTVGMGDMLLKRNDKGSNMHYYHGSDGNVWCGAAGRGISYMIKTMVPKINSSGDVDGNIGIVINMGVNDMWDWSNMVNKYIDFFKKYAPDWIAKGADVYFCSVNPIAASNGSKTGVYSNNYGYGSFSITNENIQKFNAAVASAIASIGVKYIDTYSAIINDFVASDGLHYNYNTYKKIHDYIVAAVTSGASSGVSGNTSADGSTSGSTTSSGAVAGTDGRNMLLVNVKYAKDSGGLNFNSVTSSDISTTDTGDIGSIATTDTSTTTSTTNTSYSKVSGGKTSSNTSGKKGSNTTTITLTTNSNKAASDRIMTVNQLTGTSNDGFTGHSGKVGDNTTGKSGGFGKYGRGMESIGQFLSNVISNSAVAQVLNSFLDLGGGSSGNVTVNTNPSNVTQIDASKSASEQATTTTDGSGDVTISINQDEGTATITTTGQGSNGFKPRSKYGRGTQEVAQQVYAYFTSHGFSPAGAAGIIGNMENESGLFPQRVQGDYSKGYSRSISYTQQVDSGAIGKRSFTHGGPGGGGYGLVQFTFPTLKEGLYDKAKSSGRSIGDMGVQLETISTQLDSGLINKLKTATNPGDAANAFLRGYERPANMNKAEPIRRKAAIKYYNEFSGKTFTYTGSDGGTADGSAVAGATNGSSGLSSIGQWLSNVIANSAAAQVLNSFLDLGGGSSSAAPAADATATTTDGAVVGADGNIVGAEAGGTIPQLMAEYMDRHWTRSDSSGYGAYRSSYGGRLHAGLDLCFKSNGSTGRAIKSFTVGKVYKTGSNPSGRGYYVVVQDNNGYFHIYQHLNKACTLSNGTAINIGTVVGGYGNSGASHGNHLHYEVRPPQVVNYPGGVTGTDPGHSGFIRSKSELAKYTVSPYEYLQKYIKASSTTVPNSATTSVPATGDVNNGKSLANSGYGNNGIKPRSKYGMAKKKKDGKTITNPMNPQAFIKRFNKITDSNKNTHSITISKAGKGSIGSYNTFKNNIYGKGSGAANKFNNTSTSAYSNITTSESYTSAYSNGYTGRRMNHVDGMPANIMRSDSIYGRGTDYPAVSAPNYANAIRQIIDILVRVASNTDKLNTIITILNEKLGINITSQDVANAQYGNSASEKLAAAIANSNSASTSKLNTYADTVGDQSMNSIIVAMNAIASE